MKNPLIKRLPRELKGEIGKYIVLFLFITMMIGIVSGFLVAAGSMSGAYDESFEKYNIESGNFELLQKADDDAIKKIEDGEEKIKVYENFYLDKETKEVDSTIRLFKNRKDIDRICIMDGELPSADDEIAIDRMYADNNKLKVGDSLTVGFSDYSINLGGALICGYTGVGPDAIVNRSAVKSPTRGQEVALDVLAAAQPRKLYILLGTNTLTTLGASDRFLAYYGQMLDTLRETNDDWYFLIPAGATDTIITALSTWASATVLTLAQLESGMVESEKLLIAQTKTKSLINTAMKANKQTVICYNHDADNTSIPAAWVGRVAPNYPTSVTWKWKELYGIPVTDEKGTDREDLLEGRYNMYIERHGREYMSEGICTDGDFIDTVIGRWQIKQTMRKRLVNELVDTENIGYDDDGFAAIAGVVIAALDDAVDNGIIMKQNGKGCYNVVIPKRADATDEQARNRVIPPIEWEATVRGGVHGVKVTGTLTVALVTANE